MIIFSSLQGIVESKKVLDWHAMSKLCAVMKAFIKDIFTKSWTTFLLSSNDKTWYPMIFEVHYLFLCHQILVVLKSSGYWEC